MGVIRKEAETNKSDGSAEQRILKHLKRLSHPNVLELLASYTFRGTSNLIFPRAQQNLADFLRCEGRHECFSSDHNYFHALAGLASALEKFQRYRSDELQVELSGIHGHLEPGSILVQQDRFILAGFEGSRLSHDTSMEFPLGYQNQYTAPEAELEDFKPGEITSASDMWSFGCIAAELATYMAKGAMGVAEFAAMRKTKVSFFTHQMFHHSPRENPGVRRWLDLLASGADFLRAKFISLVRDILSIDPQTRPTAQLVTLRLEELTLLGILDSIDTLYKILLNEVSSAELEFERERYRLWCWVGGLRELDGEKNEFPREYFRDYDIFEQTAEVLCGINSEMIQLRSIVAGCGKSRPLYEYIQLKTLTDKLCNMLSSPMLFSMNSRLELEINKTVTKSPQSVEEEKRRTGGRRLKPDSQNLDLTRADTTSSRVKPIQQKQKQKQLCAQCAALDLDSIFNRKYPTSHSFTVIKTWPIAKSSIALCTLCNLLADLVPPKLRESHDLRLRLFSSSRIPEMGQKSIETNLLGWDDRGPFLVAQSQGAYPIRILKTNSIDYSIILSWLQHCQSMHTGICGARTLPSFSFLKLIDCNTRSIVPASNHQYLTLSYVWGPSQSDRSENLFFDTLPANLPHTIEDAISVTKKLGFRYLWIDRYCIDRSNKEDAEKQLSQMNVIYQNSVITIIAAIGEDPSYGLPGVGNRERTAQPSADVGEHLLVSTMEDPRMYIRSSTWMTRGWTYQEALLSTRRLIFTDQQVYYECYGMYCCETRFSLPDLLVKDHQGQHLQKAYRDEKFIGMFPTNGVGSSPWEITLRIEEYTKRSLTYDSDTLGALLGILKAFENGLVQEVRHCWGVPILPLPDRDLFSNPQKHEFTRSADPDPEFSHISSNQNNSYVTESRASCPESAGFFIGLCWGLEKPSRRRLGFPSWSWAGWAGHVSWQMEEAQWKLVDIDSDINVSFELCDGRKISFNEFYRSYEKLNSPSVISQFVYITAYITIIRVIGRSDSRYKTKIDLEDGFYLDWDFYPTSDKDLPNGLYVAIHLGRVDPKDAVGLIGSPALVVGSVGDRVAIRDRMERVGFGWFHANVLEYSREKVGQNNDGARLTGPSTCPKLKLSSKLPRSCQEIRLG
jgi:serine/threonine protein kinase